MVQSQVTLCTHNELFYLQNAGKEINSRQAVCIYVQEEDTGEYN